MSKYKNKIGVVIGTLGAPAYISLHLECRERFDLDIPYLVVDDGSPYKESLEYICNYYNCNFKYREERAGHFWGDFKTIKDGLSWAKENQLDYLVKLSRRYLPLFNWVESLDKLIEEKPAKTYNTPCKNYKLPSRTESIVFKVDDWYEHMKEVDHKCKSVEYTIGREMRKLGFELWPMIGEAKTQKLKNILWHETYKPEIYHFLSNLWDLDWLYEDFANPDDGIEYIRYGQHGIGFKDNDN